MCACVCVCIEFALGSQLVAAGRKQEQGGAGEQLAKRTKLEVQLKTLATLRIRLVIGTR